MIHRREILVLAAFLLFSTGCASVKISRVKPNDFATEGMRFYRPRPYILVHEPFVIESNALLARGQLTLDGQYVLVGSLESASDKVKELLQKHMAFNLTVGASIPAGKVLLTNPSPGSKPGALPGHEQADVKNENSPAGDQTGQKPNPDANQKPAPGKPQAEEPGKGTGILNYKVTNDNSSFAIMPLKRYFDVVMLPDFDEEYVVTAKAGIGNASVGLTLGQGWSLQGVDTAADNSALMTPVLGLIRSGMDAAETLAKGYLGLPSAISGAGPQAAIIKPTAETLPGGTPLSIKITLVKVAAPGLYPLLKPSELACLRSSTATDCKCPVDLKSYADDYILPVPPLTAYALKTYELLIVEAAKASGDSITNIQRYFDTAPAPVGGSGAAAPVAEGMSDLEQKCQSAIAPSARKLKHDGTYWSVDSLSPSADGKTITAIVRAHPTGSTPPEKPPQIESIIREALAGAGVDTTNLTVSVQQK